MGTMIYGQYNNYHCCDMNPLLIPCLDRFISIRPQALYQVVFSEKKGGDTF